MVVCVVIYVILFVLVQKRKRGKLPEWFTTKLLRVLFVSNTIAVGLFAADFPGTSGENVLTRNTYGGGSKIESYEVTVEGELEDEPLVIEVEEREYDSLQIQENFGRMMEELDSVILGENESCDRVEKDLNLVESLEGYPVNIRWELDDYEVLDADGHILPEQTKPEGTLVEVRGTLSYGSEEAVYVTHVMVYPETKTGTEKWIEKISEIVRQAEEDTRQEETFSLPESIDGKEIQWQKKADMRGYYVLLLGIVCCAVLVWKTKQDEKEAGRKREIQMIRDYPDIISKFTLLLSTGMTVKQVWAKIVRSYEQQKGERAAYEEMRVTYREMQSGISEVEAYERFGKRCGITLYMKFGALLSQNIRKGNKGLTELLKMESIQAFENRKSVAKRQGEEASTKLMMPMFGMLAVVMVMVIVPAFLSIQL